MKKNTPEYYQLAREIWDDARGLTSPGWGITLYRGPKHRCIHCARRIYLTDLRQLLATEIRIMPGGMPGYEHTYNCRLWSRRQIPCANIPVFQEEHELITHLREWFFAGNPPGPREAWSHLYRLCTQYGISHPPLTSGTYSIKFSVPGASLALAL